MTTNLDTALRELRPSIAADYAAQIRRQFARMVEHFGDASLRGINNAYVWAPLWRETVRPATAATVSSDRRSVSYAINEEKLAVIAADYAEEATLAWRDKIAAKMGELDRVSIERLGSATFRITGWRGGCVIELVQSMIVNVSSKGKVFNQFPAHMRVDGGAKSWAAYQRMFQVVG